MFGSPGADPSCETRPTSGDSRPDDNRKSLLWQHTSHRQVREGPPDCRGVPCPPKVWWYAHADRFYTSQGTTDVRRLPLKTQVYKEGAEPRQGGGSLQERLVRDLSGFLISMACPISAAKMWFVRPLESGLLQSVTSSSSSPLHHGLEPVF